MPNVTLCGFMGSGKTTVGKALAKRLGFSFADTDAEIESRAGLTVAEIFEKMGEPAFRRMESEVIKDMAHLDGVVISVGGGTVLNEENVRTLKACGKVVLLDVDAATVISRLSCDVSRPLLAGPDKEQRAEALLSERRPLYEAAADIVVDGRGSAAKVAEKIAEQLKIGG